MGHSVNLTAAFDWRRRTSLSEEEKDSKISQTVTKDPPSKGVFGKMNPTPPFPHRPPAAAPTRLMRPPFVDTQTNIMYDVNDPEHEGWLTKQSTWLKVRLQKRREGCYCAQIHDVAVHAGSS